MFNKKELELLKQTGVNDKEVTEKLVNFLRHEFDNVVRVKKEDYEEYIVKLVDNKQGSYTFIDNDSGDFLFKISIFNKEVDGKNTGLSFIALTKQGWLLTKTNDEDFVDYPVRYLLDTNSYGCGFNLAKQLVENLDGQEIATKEGTLPVYEVTGNESVIEFVNENNLLNKMFVLKNGNNCLIVDNVIFDDSDNYYYFKGVLYLNYDSGSIHFTDEAYSTEDFADTIDALFYAMSEVSLLATIRYVDNNKGTKLYFKRILDSNRNIQIRLFLLDTSGFISDVQPIIQGVYGYASNQKHYVFKYCTPSNNSCSMIFYCIEDANEINVTYTNSDLID